MIHMIPYLQMLIIDKQNQANISQLDTHIYQICSKHPDGGKPSSRVFLSINALRLDRPCVLVNFGASWHQRQAGVRWLT